MSTRASIYCLFSRHFGLLDSYIIFGNRVPLKAARDMSDAVVPVMQSHRSCYFLFRNRSVFPMDLYFIVVYDRCSCRYVLVLEP